MPRFQDEHVAVLKRVMLPRLPGCYFAPEDVSAVQAETGLNQAQIEKWADHLRFRMPKTEDRDAFLRRTAEQEKVCFMIIDTLASCQIEERDCFMD